MSNASTQRDDIDARPIAYTSQRNLDRLRENPSFNSVMWGEPLPHHEDIALYIHPSPSTHVKPLEWVQMDDGSTFHAQSILGRWARWEGHYLPPEGYGGIPCDDPIAAAQADYESRILSALITTAPQTKIGGES